MADLRGLSIKQLRAFAAVAHTGSITQAAQALSVTPPAVTTHLKTLEAMAGAPVLDRSGEVATPTAVGRELLRAAEEIEAAVARAQERLQALGDGSRGRVVFGVVSTAKYLAPHMVAAFRAERPLIKVALRIGNRREIVAGLARGAYDLAVMGRPPPEHEVGGAALEQAELGPNPHLLVAAPNHPLAQTGEELTPKHLFDQTILTREPGSGTRLLTERYLDSVGEGWVFEIEELGSNETIKQAVIAGLGVALLSQHTCLAELADGRLVALPLAGFPLMRRWFLLWRADRQPDAATVALREFILENRAALLPSGPTSGGEKSAERPAAE
ncbi:MAG: LysR family transcriptional regulator [Pseudomonadota bacterium]